MKKEIKNRLIIPLFFMTSFVVWTVLVKFIDVKAIGPNNSLVGFATINKYFHQLIGVNISLYNITDWLGLVPIIVCLCFGILGLIQLIKRKNILKIDYSLLVLGGFYIVVIVAYLFFEKCIINYRPILINGYLEPSYPSSTTLLVMCVMPTAIIQLNTLIKNKTVKRYISIIIILFTAFMVIGRLLSGVHWLTDILGGSLLSIGLVTSYLTIIDLKKLMK